MLLRKFAGGLAVLAVALVFAAAPVTAAPGDTLADPLEISERNMDYVVGEDLC